MTPRLLLAAALAAAASYATPAGAGPCVDMIVPGPVIAVCPERPDGPPLVCLPAGAATVCVTP